MATFMIIHGAWSAGWAWKKMRPLLRERGHEVFTPTCTGLGERAHQANLAVDLDTHIADVAAVLQFEDLHDVVLVGHSYGGMVATGVADRAAARIAQLVYLDAFMPRDGECLFDLVLAAARANNLEAVRTRGDGWRVPVNPMPTDTDAADVAWATLLRQPMTLKCFESPVHLQGAFERLRRSYIYSATRRAMSSSPLPSAPAQAATGGTSNSTPATTRTSRCRIRWRNCCTASPPASARRRSPRRAALGKARELGCALYALRAQSPQS